MFVMRTKRQLLFCLMNKLGSWLLRLVPDGSSIYPDELDILYGDTMLFKVDTKVFKAGSISPSYEIIDMLTDPFILDKFFQYYMPSYGAFDCSFGRLSPSEVFDEFSSTEEEFSSEESYSFELKRKAKTIHPCTDNDYQKKSFKNPRVK
ncbi:hypothetical protein TSUD_281510 [Trifolium subterraneum]|uniref:Uncharacterized protein n=1 Tax=Trifolium subterraneum TaxID=3900 RepID=A0A2Z6LYA0_TRISU|nr:hypothetical protein TSUD_281510 [Trifolium subterraneum]